MASDHDRASGVHAFSAEIDGGDALSDVLELIRLTGAVFFCVDAAPPWSAEAPCSPDLAPAILPRAQHVVSYHVLIEGACWCRMEGEAPVRLESGDVIVVPHGDSYGLSSAADLDSGLTLAEMLEWFRQMSSGRLPFVVREGGPGPGSIRVFCGFLGCDALPFNPVLRSLPKLLHVRRPASAEIDGLDRLVELAISESEQKRSGSRSVLLRIGELMFVEVLRRYLTRVGAGERGWLAGLRDPVVGRALARLHQEPARAWTLEDLAREAAASRSVLTERFTYLVGEPPMHYLARWRVQRAAAKLASDPSTKVSAVAREVGYDSEAAFSRAFKRLTGVAPAAFRSSGSKPS